MEPDTLPEITGQEDAAAAMEVSAPVEELDVEPEPEYVTAYEQFESEMDKLSEAQHHFDSVVNVDNYQSTGKRTEMVFAASLNNVLISFSKLLDLLNLPKTPILLMSRQLKALNAAINLGTNAGFKQAKELESKIKNEIDAEKNVILQHMGFQNHGDDELPEEADEKQQEFPDEPPITGMGRHKPVTEEAAPRPWAIEFKKWFDAKIYQQGNLQNRPLKLAYIVTEFKKRLIAQGIALPKDGSDKELRNQLSVVLHRWVKSETTFPNFTEYNTGRILPRESKSGVAPKEKILIITGPPARQQQAAEPVPSQRARKEVARPGRRPFPGPRPGAPPASVSLAQLQERDRQKRAREPTREARNASIIAERIQQDGGGYLDRMQKPFEDPKKWGELEAKFVSHMQSILEGHFNPGEDKEDIIAAYQRATKQDFKQMINGLPIHATYKHQLKDSIKDRIKVAKTQKKLNTAFNLGAQQMDAIVRLLKPTHRNFRSLATGLIQKRKAIANLLIAENKGRSFREFPTHNAYWRRFTEKDSQLTRQQDGMENIDNFKLLTDAYKLFLDFNNDEADRQVHRWNAMAKAYNSAPEVYRHFGDVTKPDQYGNAIKLRIFAPTEVRRLLQDTAGQRYAWKNYISENQPLNEPRGVMAQDSGHAQVAPEKGAPADPEQKDEEEDEPERGREISDQERKDAAYAAELAKQEEDALGAPAPAAGPDMSSYVRFGEDEEMTIEEKTELVKDFFKVDYKNNLWGKLRYVMKHLDAKGAGVQPAAIQTAKVYMTEFYGYAKDIGVPAQVINKMKQEVKRGTWEKFELSGMPNDAVIRAVRAIAEFKTQEQKEAEKLAEQQEKQARADQQARDLQRAVAEQQRARDAAEPQEESEEMDLTGAYFETPGGAGPDDHFGPRGESGEAFQAGAAAESSDREEGEDRGESKEESEEDEKAPQPGAPPEWAIRRAIAVPAAVGRGLLGLGPPPVAVPALVQAPAHIVIGHVVPHPGAVPQEETAKWNEWLKLSHNSFTKKVIQERRHRNYYEYKPTTKEIVPKYKHYNVATTVRQRGRRGRERRGRKVDEVAYRTPHPQAEHTESTLKNMFKQHEFATAHEKSEQTRIGEYVQLEIAPKILYIKILKGAQEQAIRILARRLYEHINSAVTRLFIKKSGTKKYSYFGKYSYKLWLSAKLLQSISEPELFSRIREITNGMKKSVTIIVKQNISVGSIQELWNIKHSLL